MLQSAFKFGLICIFGYPKYDLIVLLAKHS